MGDLQRLIKSDRWWDDKASPVLGQVYLLMLLHPPTQPVWQTLAAMGLFMLSFVGVAAYGHLVNDLADIPHDLQQGKANSMAGRSPGQQATWLALALAVGVLPWLAWPADARSALAWLLVQLALLTAYAVPPLRLKTRALAGVLADALYAYTVPGLVTWAAWTAGWPAPAQPPAGLLATMLAWTLCVGLRGILHHQLLDLEADRATGQQTLATRLGEAATWRLLAGLVLPGEVLAFLVLVLLLSGPVPGALLCVPAVLGWRVFQLAWLWNQPLRAPWTLGPAQRVDQYGYLVLNNFYTRWFPLLALSGLVLHRPALWPLLAAHLLLFPNGLVEFIVRDARWLPSALRRAARRHG